MTKVWKLPTDAECREILNYILDSHKVEILEVPGDRTYRVRVNDIEFHVGVPADGHVQTPTNYDILYVELK